MQEKLIQALPIRIFHWVQALLIFIMLFSGFTFTYAGWVGIPIHYIRLFHATPGYLLAINLLLYIYYYGSHGTYDRVLFGRKDFGNVGSFAKYITFQTKDHPPYGKYNPGQKAVFTMWLMLLLGLITTGLSLLHAEPAGLIQRLVGGLSNLRVIHYAGAVILACTVPLHIYLALTEDPARLQAIFTGYVKE